MSGRFCVSTHCQSVVLWKEYLWKKSDWLTNRTRAQTGGLFYEAVEIGHLLVQRTEGHVFTLQRFSSQALVVLQMLAESIYAKLRNLGHRVSSD